MQRQGQLPVHCHFIDRRALGGVDNVLRNTLFQRFFNDRRVVRVEEYVALTLIEIRFMLCARRFFDTVRIIEQYAKVADTPDAGLRTHGRLAGLNARITEDAFF